MDDGFIDAMHFVAWTLLRGSFTTGSSGLNGGDCMKVTVDIDCTPEEARRFMGLPDMSPIHDVYLDKMRQALTEGVTPDMLETMFKSWAPMSEMSMNAWRQMFDQMTGTSKS